MAAIDFSGFSADHVSDRMTPAVGPGGMLSKRKFDDRSDDRSVIDTIAAGADLRLDARPMADFPAAPDRMILGQPAGIRIKGIDAFDYSGRSVSSAGDFNGDGFDDIIIGAPGADIGRRQDVGESYLIFGKAGGFPETFNPATLDGSNGFRLVGIGAEDRSGYSVSDAGDVNGDGFDDIIISAPAAYAGIIAYAGSSYVVFGRAGGFDASFDLAALDGNNGFRLDGVSTFDYSGESVSSAGDVNGDGFDDIIIGARYGDPGGDGSAGESYVVFGRANGFAASLSLAALDGSNGFRLDGIDRSDFSGISVSSAGDFNGDGFEDIVIGAFGANQPGDVVGGETYLVFGKAGGYAASVDLASLDGVNGFRIDGRDYSGYSVSSAGDFNGDGLDDIIIGSYGYNGGISGSSYVVFGRSAGVFPTLDLASLDGENGFRLVGAPGDASGFSVSSAGDFNGDGFDDILIGAPYAESDKINSGESYVVFGKADGFAPVFDLGTLDGSNGFSLAGLGRRDDSGSAVSSAGDVNGDGFDDIIIGAAQADSGADKRNGESFVVFGRASADAEIGAGPAADQEIFGGDAPRVRAFPALDRVFGEDAGATLWTMGGISRNAGDMHEVIAIV